MNFVHYTKEIEAVSGILENGLLLNPLPRKVMHLFSSSIKFKSREPQQFGLASLRGESILGSIRHLKRFGEFGIVFDPSWVRSKDFRKVIYIKEGTKTHYDLKKLFDNLTIKHIPRELNQDADSLASAAASRRA